MSDMFFMLLMKVLGFDFLTTMIGTGQTGWENQTPSFSYPGLLGIDAIDSMHVWAVGNDGTVIRTMNGGVTWNSVRTGFDDNFSDP